MTPPTPSLSDAAVELFRAIFRAACGVVGWIVGVATGNGNGRQIVLAHGRQIVPSPGPGAGTGQVVRSAVHQVALSGQPGPRISNAESNGQEEAELHRLATGSLLARIAGFLSVREGGVQNVLVAAPSAERIVFREDYLSNNITAFLSEAVFPAEGGAIGVSQHLASQWARHKIKTVLATPAGAKFLRQSAASAGCPYALDSDGRVIFVPSRAFGNVCFAIAFDNCDLLEWAMEVGSLDPNGCHDCGVIGDEVYDGQAGQAQHLLYMSICCGSTECFDWLLAREDVDPNASAYVDPDHWYSVVSACILCAYSGYFGDVAYFLRRLIEHTAADINEPSTSIGRTPLQVWAVAFSSSFEPPVVQGRVGWTLEGTLRILNCLLEGGAKCRRSDNLGPDATPSPFKIVRGGTISGSLEHRARHLLALDLMRGGGVVWYFLLFGKGTSVVDRMHGMVASALKLGVPSSFIEFLFDLVRIITFPPFVIKRGLNDFMVDLVRLTVALVIYYTLICT